MALFDLLSNDELPGGGLSINVLFLLSIDLLVGLLELFRLVLHILQQTGVVCESILECTLAEDTPIETDVDYKVCDRARHRDVVRLSVRPRERRGNGGERAHACLRRG